MDHVPSRIEAGALASMTRRVTPRNARKPWRAACRWLAACADRRRGRLVLRDADDQLLQDIGKSRAEAWAESRKPCWRR